MPLVSTFLIFYLIGTLGAWRPDIDINRVKLLTKEESHKPHSNLKSTHNRRSIFSHKHLNNDYDNRSRRVSQSQEVPQIFPDRLPPSEPAALKVYEPREDPRLFYLSDAYLKEINEKKLSNEVSAVYPGREVVHASDYDYNNDYRRSVPYRMRMRPWEMNYLEEYRNENFVCVKCPQDKTIIAKPGSAVAMLPYVDTKPCSGSRVPRGIRYEHLHGPKFGSLLPQGTYSVVGKIMFKGKLHKYCFMEIHVLTQTCPLPTYLVANCDDQNKTCNFSCHDINAELRGPSRLLCGDDNQWIGQLPDCRVVPSNWCKPPSPPSHGRVSCRGSTVHGSGLAEGSTCRVQCARGWKRHPHKLTECRNGAWSRQLDCSKE